MLVQQADINFRRSLSPVPFHFGGTGALPPSYDARDLPPEAHPGVVDLLVAGVPEAADRSGGVCEILDQGASGACVVFSTCTGIQLDNNLDRQVCYHFDAAAMYREMGGTGQNGIDTRAELQACVDRGAPIRDGGGRVKIGSYFRCDSTPDLFVTQIKAAVASGQVAVVATLLPNTFAGIWTPGSPTQGYHQLVIVGFRGDLFWGPNTWGRNWGGGNHPPGFYELSFNYVTSNNFLGGYTYAYFFDPFEVHGQPTPIPTPIPTPTPAPVTRIVVTAIATGAGAAGIGVGQTLSLGNVSAVLTVTDVHQEQGPGPEPNPNPNPNPNPEPQPLPGTLTPQVSLFRGGVQVTAKDAAGRFVTAQVTARVDAGVLVGFRTQTTAVNDGAGANPATFSLRGAWTLLTVTVTAGDQSGTVTVHA